MKEQNPFKEKLYQHTLPVSDELWGRIEAQLPTKVDKKRLPFFWFVLAAVVLTAGILLYINATKKDQQKENINPDKKEVPAPAVHPDVTPVSYQQSISGDNSIAQNGSINSRFETTTSSTENQSASSTSSTPHSIDKRNMASGDTQISSYGSEEKENRSTIKLSSKKSEKGKASISKNRPTETPFVKSDSYSVTVVQKTFANAPALDAIQTGITVIDDEKHMLDVSSIFPDPSCYKFTEEEGKSNISVDLFVSGGFTPRSFESHSTEDLLYVEARERTEKNKYVWGGGARINWNVSEDIVLRAGIMYEQIGDLFDYTDTSATQRTTRIDSFFSADGTFLYAETNTELIFGTLVKKIHNRYHHLDIPLLASYELCLGRSILMLNVGPVINLSTSFRGQILNPAFVPQHITQSESNRLDAYKTNLGLSLYIGAGALIPINKNFSGLIEPRFLYRIKPVTEESYPLKEHRHFAGVNAGIRYHFD